MSTNEPNAFLVRYQTYNGGVYPDGTDEHTLIIRSRLEMPINDGIFIISIEPVYIEYFPNAPPICFQKLKFRIQRRKIRRERNAGKRK